MEVGEKKSLRGEKEKQEVELTPQEKRLLDYFRHDLQYGEVVIIVKRGQPVFIRQVMKEVKLD
jgi:hypothetical protein